MNTISERLEKLRKQMFAQGVDGLIVPSNDPHFSEYVADRWKCRSWISGFTGSAGTAVITMDSAALWTDSRYFVQAEEQLKGSGFTLKKLKIAGTETIEEWLKQQLSPKSQVAIDKELFSIAEFNRMKVSLAPLSLIPSSDFFEPTWANRPTYPAEKAFILNLATTGESISSKLERLRASLSRQEGFIYPITLLDETAWLYNLRGADISYNPLAIAYGLVSSQHAYLFINPDKLTEEEIKHLQAEGVAIYPYQELKKVIKELADERCCIYNPRKTSVGLFQTLEECSFDLIEENDSNGTICSLKSVKNEVEQKGFRQAMVDDGVALVRFQYWLEQGLGKQTITECSAAAQLNLFRSECKSFVSDSFAPIMGYKEHGAIIHYSATEETDAAIAANGFLLFDTGAQYLYGTTDVTRTIHLGNPNEQEKEDYTLVLKGMIALSAAKFPVGTRGTQLDVLARQYLWSKGKTYLHGTGHGVGHFLNVHEGPQSIRMEENPVMLVPGMVTSNEPGVYIEGQYGIRIENLILCQTEQASGMNGFLGFETLTLAPIDTKPINKSMLTETEVSWLNSYHQMVFDTLSPRLGKDELKWLEEKTKLL